METILPDPFGGEVIEVDEEAIAPLTTKSDPSLFNVRGAEPPSDRSYVLPLISAEDADPSGHRHANLGPALFPYGLEKLPERTTLLPRQTHHKKIPTPLKFPKPFSTNNLSHCGQAYAETDTGPSTVDSRNMPAIPIPPQIIPMPLVPSHQQMFYNTQTGTIVSVPLHTSLTTASVDAALPQQQQILVIPQQPVQTSAEPHQIKYLKTTGGQFVPVITPLSSGIGPCNFSQDVGAVELSRFYPPRPHIRKPVCSTPLSASTNSNDTAATSFDALSMLETQESQRRHIEQQRKIHPDANIRCHARNVSDIFEEKEPEMVSIGTSAGRSANEHAFVAQHNMENDKMTHNEKDPAPVESEIPPEQTTSQYQKISGTLTLGTFTYRYSQTLTGNLIKDKELFDCLVDSAWKACITKP